MSQYVEPSANLTQKVVNAGGAGAVNASLNSVVIGAAYNVVSAGTEQSQVQQIAAIANPSDPVVYRSAASGYVFNDHVPPNATGAGAGWNDPMPGWFQMALPAAIAGQKVSDGSFDLILKNAQVRQNVLLAESIRVASLQGLTGNTANGINHDLGTQAIEVLPAVGSGLDGAILSGDYWLITGANPGSGAWNGTSGKYLVALDLGDFPSSNAGFIIVDTLADAQSIAHRIRLSSAGAPLSYDDTWVKLAGSVFNPDGSGTGGAYAPDANGYDGTSSTLIGDVVKYSVWYANYTLDVTTEASYLGTGTGSMVGIGVTGISDASVPTPDVTPITYTTSVRDVEKSGSDWRVRLSGRILADGATEVSEVVSSVDSITSRGTLVVSANGDFPTNAAQPGGYWTVSSVGTFLLGDSGTDVSAPDGSIVVAKVVNPRTTHAADWDVYATLALAQAAYSNLVSRGTLTVTANNQPLPSIAVDVGDYWVISIASGTFTLGSSNQITVANGNVVVVANATPAQDGANWTKYATASVVPHTVTTVTEYLVRTALSNGSANALENDNVMLDVYRVVPTLTIPLDQTPAAADTPWIVTLGSDGFVQEVDTVTNPDDGQAKLTQSTNYLNTTDATSSGFVVIPNNFHSAGRASADGVNTLYGLISDVPEPAGWNMSIIRYADAVYLGYRALRTDLSNRLLTWNSLDAIDAQFRYIGQENPLGLAAQVAYIATGAIGVPIYGYAVDSDDLEGHVGALDYLSTRRDVHCFGIINRNAAVASTYKAHVEGMSTPLENSWRVAVANVKYPDRQYLVGGDTVDELATAAMYQVVSRNLANIPQYNATSYTTRIRDVSVDFLSAGVTPGDIVEIPVFGLPDGASLPSGTVAGSFIGLWQVSEVLDAHDIKVTPFGGTTYPSSYFGDTSNRPTGTVPDSSTAFVPYSIYRPASKDYQATFLKAFSTTLKTRRVWHIQPDTLTIEIGGTPTEVGGEYAVAHHVGLCAAARPQQNFTRMSAVGLSDLKHSNFYFSRTQMRDIASAGVCFLVQKVPEGLPFISHALTTDTTALFYQEQMKTRNIDFLSYVFWEAMDPFIGRWNQTAGLYTTARTVLQGIAKRLMTQTDTIIGPPLLGFKIKTMEQSKVNPDRMLLVLSCAIVDPTNYIDITLEV